MAKTAGPERVNHVFERNRDISPDIVAAAAARVLGYPRNATIIPAFDRTRGQTFGVYSNGHGVDKAPGIIIQAVGGSEDTRAPLVIAGQVLTDEPLTPQLLNRRLNREASKLMLEKLGGG